MAESDDETAFASADEGEEETPVKEGNAASLSRQEKEDTSIKGKGSETKTPEKQTKKAQSPESTKTKTAGAAKGGGTTQKKTVSKDKKKTVADVKEKQPGITRPTADKKQETKANVEITDKKNTESVGEKSPLPGNEQTVEKPGKVKSEDSIEGSLDSVSVSDRTDNKEKSGISDKESEKESETGELSETLMQSPGEQLIPRPEPDHTTPQEAVLERLSEAAAPEKVAASWNWGGWGTSLVKTASASVTTFTTQVGEGFNTLLESVETTLGVPMPEEFAKTDENIKSDSAKEGESVESAPVKDEGKDKVTESDEVKEESSGSVEGEVTTDVKAEQEASGGSSWFSAWGVSNITSMVQKTSKKVVTGGMDVLETIGKKTFEAISEDPGFKKTRKVIKGDKPNLSQLLRDAKDQAEINAQKDKEAEEARKAHFGALFDEFQGLAHLEALEMLSNQSEKKVQSLLGAVPPDTMAKIKPELLQLKEAFELQDDDVDEEPQDHDFVKLVTENLSELHVGSSPDKLKRCQENIRKWITDFYSNQEEEQLETKDIHQTAIQSLAEMTSKAVEQFHKSGELILTQKDVDTGFVTKAKSLASLTKVLSTEVGIMSTKFSQCLHKAGETHNQPDSAITPMVTNVYLEASNSRTYIEDAFQLLLPVLQQSTIENSKELAQ